ncbi:anti-sigma factor [Cohnella silvisoli]|uniref:Anti-sigma-W factor RsiW n=1 Tax=Cohnella silvisoli TaxID=2873699 RepID=A0ABV1KP65_9BACL|nr:anti-sigma factor [Cohnella silvisoli]MCD9020966.1 anti-sigma factor [Cohnella silvisoli]
MNNRETSTCEVLFEYLSGEGSDMQRKRVERHLATCSSCKEDAALWGEVWDRLADDVELIEPPADLKEYVLGPLMESTNDKQIKKTSTLRNRIYLRWAIGTAIVLAAFLSGWLFRDAQSGISGQETSVQTPANIETLFRLSAVRESGKFDDSTHAYGVACLVRSDNKEQFVVYVFGSPQTRGGEAYQVWLLKDGKRTSAGTFTVGASGIGIMTLPLTEGISDIDAVGVTLEPDSHSSSPRGPKMFGSSQPATSGDA